MRAYIFVILFVLSGIFMAHSFNLDMYTNTWISISKDYTAIIKSQQSTIKELRNIIRNSHTQRVKISYYSPSDGGINSDDDPDNTAIMEKPVVGLTAAVSDELFKLGWLGKRIYINGIGIRLAHDRMSSTVKGKQIDICVESASKAFRLGIKENVLAVRLD